MISYPNRFILAGVLVGALALTAYAVRTGKLGLSEDPFGLGRDDVSASRTLDHALNRSLSSGTVSRDIGSDAGAARTLQAVRDSLQRNDLASARVLLNAMQALHKDDKQALTLRQDLQAREAKVDDAHGVVRAESPQRTSESTRSVPRSMARTDRLREGSYPAGEHASRTSRHSRSKSAAQDKGQPDHGAEVVAVAPGSGSGERASSSPPITSIVPPAALQSVPVPPPSAPIIEPAKPDPLPVQSDQTPKTREQVRAELARARADGTLPRFGNPDPAGPGGTPSLTVQPNLSLGRE